MRLVDLDPDWMMLDGRRVGFTFRSPVQHSSQRPDNPTRWRQSCTVVALSNEQQFAIHGDRPIQLCNPECAWTIEGGIDHASFSTMTVKPSIDGSAGGLWHGFITNGEIVGGLP